MKTLLLILIFGICIPMSAQGPLDTIYANEQKNVALFFSEPIRQGITGAQHFVFTYNREKEQHFGLLQAQPGPESNLLVVTSKGQLYSYILKYEPQLTNLNYFIDENDSIGNEVPQKTILDSVKIDTKSNDVRSDYFNRACRHVIKSQSGYIASRQKRGISLKLLKPVYYGSEVFLIIEAMNNSGIDFEIDYLNAYKANGANRPKASFQNIQLKTIYTYDLPKIIKNRERKRFVFVLPKFVLAPMEKLILELRELKGSRSLLLDIHL
ncbi:DUF4138 domain-containing protein [Arenibacter sp. BSSL-BM3]|uniref:DUF4138 domain-containing protein n=1 Tax=Arenibacter arenosicollis TaxID=2762274 RepID=A0ABR7QR49_9FLAO|nr:DUF4138 domain-containing protein [Arenibacter arenosicollis]MBC8769675.1 DUF4138 domain-containing protein [Arenibacter arenosicollis]